MSARTRELEAGAIDLSGRVALVTGGGRSIGATISLVLAPAGADVAVNYRTSGEEARNVCAKIEAMGRRAVAIRADVADVAQCEELVRQAEAAFGRVDILVSNSGTGQPHKIVDTTCDEWDRVMNVNARATFILARKLLPGMVARRFGRFDQDHDHFFLTEYNRTHLNYWIPLVKPSPTEAGLRVIPWDRLREKSPRVFNLCRRSGASRLYSLRDGGTLYLSDWSGVIWHEEDLEIEDVMETPEVGPGDLLLLSLTTIHATQTTDDRRLAVSLRTCDPATPIDWHRVAGSPTPWRMGGLARQNKLNFPVFQATQENDFGITLADVLPTLTGERE